jgi:hypothetical protein
MGCFFRAASDVPAAKATATNVAATSVAAVSCMALARMASTIPAENELARAARWDLSVIGTSFLRVMLPLVQHRLRKGNTRFIVASLSRGLMGSYCEASRTLDEACRPAWGGGMAIPPLSLQTATVIPDREGLSFPSESMGWERPRALDERRHPSKRSWHSAAQDAGGRLENRAPSQTPRTRTGATDVAPLGQPFRLPLSRRRSDCEWERLWFKACRDRSRMSAATSYWPRRAARLPLRAPLRPRYKVGADRGTVVRPGQPWGASRLWQGGRLPLPRLWSTAARGSGPGGGRPQKDHRLERPQDA